MAEIIRPGREEKGWSREYECGGADPETGCGALLRITKDDLFTARAIGGADTTMPCPCCGKETALCEPFEDLPDADTWYATHPDVAAKRAARTAPDRPTIGRRPC